MDRSSQRFIKDKLKVPIDHEIHHKSDLTRKISVLSIMLLLTAFGAIFILSPGKQFETTIQDWLPINNKLNNITKWDGVEELSVKYIEPFLINCTISATIAILTTSKEKDLNNLLRNLEILSITFYQYNDIKYCYPLTIFHEDLKEQQITDMIAYLRNRNSYFTYISFIFVQIKFWIPNHVQVTLGNKTLIAHMRKKGQSNIYVHYHGLHKYARRGTFGYYHMCRFWLAIHKLNHMKQFDYYMRLDTDSICHKYILDYFQYLSNNNIYYLYNHKTFDAWHVTENLFNETIQYIQINNIKNKYIT
eukprot:23065_1